MKKLSLTLLILSFSLLSAETRKLPDINFNSSEEFYKLLEKRVSTRRLNQGTISDQVLGEILWAGHGLVYNGEETTVHGVDAVSGATQNPRYTIPIGSMSRVLTVYYLDNSGFYEYIPEDHQLKLIANKDLRNATGGYGRNAAGKIIIAVDKTKYKNEIKWAHHYAGSASQNIYIAAANHGISIFTEGWFNGDGVIKEAGLSKKIEPLILLSF